MTHFPEDSAIENSLELFSLITLNEILTSCYNLTLSLHIEKDRGVKRKLKEESVPITGSVSSSLI